MEDSTIQLDVKDNGLSHNGKSAIDDNGSPLLQKVVEQSVEPSIEEEVSNGINKLDGASSTTSEPVTNETSTENIKKSQAPSNGLSGAATSTELNQDDYLIRELAQFEGVKKDDEVTLDLPKLANEENGGKLQDTCDLLKDLESDSPCLPGPSDTEVDNSVSVTSDTGSNQTESMEVDQKVDSTTESSLKRRRSNDELEGTAPKKANTGTVVEAEEKDKTCATQGTTGDIDAATESKRENSDADVSDGVGEAISSTSTDTKNQLSSECTSKSNNEDIEVSSSVSNVEASATKDVDTSVVPVGNSSAKSEEEVSSNKPSETTTEVMEQDLNETAEMAEVEESKTVSKEAEKESDKTKDEQLVDNKSEIRETGQDDQSAKVLSNESTANDSIKEMEVDNDTKPQSSEASTVKYNGLSEAVADANKVDNKEAVDSAQSSHLNAAAEESPTPPESQYEISILHEQSAFKSLTVEKVEKKESTVDDGKSDAATTQSPNLTKHTVTGMVELCNFMISHFGAIKSTFTVDTNGSASATSNKRGKSKKSASAASSPSNTTPKSTKRGTKRQATDESEKSEPKSKQSKSAAAATANDDDEEVEEVKGDCCLARWSDKKYYAGRVIDEKPGNKFVVLFEDGASKVLAHEYIVFGTGNVLPLMDHSVHVLVSDDTYAPGLVTKIDTDGETVMYTVTTESKTVTCSSSNIYLMDDQAKFILNAIKAKDGGIMRTPETPSSKRTGRLPAKLEETVTTSGGRSSRGKKGQAVLLPEPGFSGNVDAKKPGRRSAKR